MSIVLRPAAATGLLLVYCLLLVAVSPPRRVGDGVEYWAMAEQMRSGRLPSATRGELARLEREARTIGHGFDTSPLRFPQLAGADGRQDFPHFWLYPLVNVPALALATALRVHPNWAFTITNIALLSLAFVIVSRRVSIAWAALILAGPLVWWLDKAHGDVFTVTLLAVACACWYARPAISVVLIALAAAQNPALVPVWGLTCALSLWPLVATGLRQRDRQRQRPHRAGAGHVASDVGSDAEADVRVDASSECATAAGTSADAAVEVNVHANARADASSERTNADSDAAADANGATDAAARLSREAADAARGTAFVAAIAVSACIVALPLAYYKLRLDVWSPLIGYTRPSWPSLRAMASLLADANVGLIPNAPFVIVAALLTLAISARRRDASARASGWRGRSRVARA